MNKKHPITAYEFCSLYVEGEAHKEGDIPLEESTFNDLWDFILSNKSSDDSDIVMSVHTRGGRRYIRTGRYVGTLQTRNGQVIEVLPKIYRTGGQQEKDKEICRSVLLNMLRHFTNFKARTFQNASLNTKKGFPILEVYISNYIDAVEQLVLGGIKKNYALKEENLRFLKGRLEINKQLTRNITNKTKFAVIYNKYIEDIPQNRVVVTTLRKLYNDSHNTSNKAHISALLTILAEIPTSTNIENDLRLASKSNRLFNSYDLLIKWSSQFLINRGFTAFAGSYVNQSLLFQAERLFESFVAYLFKRYAPTYKVSTQNTRYFLVDRHNGKRMFQLRPDIVVEADKNSDNYDCIIIDTKWKAIDATRPDRHYLIDMKDMYQLYAYGQKYRQGQSIEMDDDIIPKLVLIYPYSERFTEHLPEFVYDDVKDKIGLRLMVVPFNLVDSSSYRDQIHEIIHSLDVKSDEQPKYTPSARVIDWDDDKAVLNNKSQLEIPFDYVDDDLFFSLKVADPLVIKGSLPVHIPDHRPNMLKSGQLNFVLMYAVAPNAREKTEKSGKIALGLKEDNISEEAIAAFSSIKYILFHYWKNENVAIYQLLKNPKIVNNSHIPDGYLKRQEKDAKKYLLLDYGNVPTSFGDIDILKVGKKGTERYLPFVTTIESLKK